MKTITILTTLVLAAQTALAQGPGQTGDYYRTANGLKGKALKTALHKIIKEPSVVSYNGLQAAYVKTDTRPDGYLRDWYSDSTQFVPGADMVSGNKYEGWTYNREHSVCQSWFKSASPMYSDVMQVIPTDGYINSRHNDNPFGDVDPQGAKYAESKAGFSKWGSPLPSTGAPDSVTTVFEPNDRVKGDIARIYFYMATCYEDRVSTFTEGKGRFVFRTDSNTYEPLQPWVMEMMMRWAAQDPVDSIEQARNDSVFVVQRNRNPFVDYPGLEDYVWGEKKEQAFSYDHFDEVDADTTQYPFVATSTTILLNSNFFDCSWTGSMPKNGEIQLTGRQDGVMVVYAKDLNVSTKGSNMYCNWRQLRLYKKNALRVEALDEHDMDSICFVVDTITDKAQTLNASVGTVRADSAVTAYGTQVKAYVWTGAAKKVDFYINDQAGNIQLSQLSVYITPAPEPQEDPTCISSFRQPTMVDHAIYTLQGVRVTGQPKPGIYIRNGKKILVR